MDTLPSFPSALGSLFGQVRPEFEAEAALLRERYPNYRFEIDEDDLNPNIHGLSVSCVFPVPSVPADGPDEVVLSLTFYGTTGAWRGMLDLTWGNPSGHVEDSLPYEWEFSSEWPVFTKEFADEILMALPKLLKSFEQAVARGGPE